MGKGWGNKGGWEDKTDWCNKGGWNAENFNFNPFNSFNGRPVALGLGIQDGS